MRYWYIWQSRDGFRVSQFGIETDENVPADYDGDGETDLAVWRGGSQSQYWVYGSQVGTFVLPWGIESDSVVRY